MRRFIAISQILLSPGVLVAALALSCIYAMPECSAVASCHEQRAVKAGDCCAGYGAGPAASPDVSKQFQLSMPETAVTLLAHAAPAEPGSDLLCSPIFASPPILTLRI
jgi:hypothetical protein